MTKKLNRRSAQNAKRTYEGAARRYEKQAGKAKGSEKRALNKAASRMRNQARKIESALKKDKLTPEIGTLVSNAAQFKSKTPIKQLRGNALGNALLDGTNAGHRFYSLTRDIWQDVEYGDRLDAIREYFDGATIAEIIDAVSEKSGVDILKGNINLDTDSLGGLEKAEYLEALGRIMLNEE